MADIVVWKINVLKLRFLCFKKSYFLLSNLGKRRTGENEPYYPLNNKKMPHFYFNDNVIKQF